MEFELAQSILTSAIYIIWYGFFGIVIFDFLYGIPAFIQQQAGTKSFTAPTQEINQKQPLQQTCIERSNDESITPISNVDETTIEYLQMVGADIEDFESILEAREFLDNNAPWSIETIPKPVEQSVANADSNTFSQSNTEGQEKLTCQQVQVQFASLGYFFEKYRTGHNRYRVKVDGLCIRFKTLNDALDWLDLSKRLIQVATR